MTGRTATTSRMRYMWNARCRESEKKKATGKYSFFWRKDLAGIRFESRTGPLFPSVRARGCLRDGQGTRGHDRVSCSTNETSQGENQIVRCRERNVFPRRYVKQCP